MILSALLYNFAVNSPENNGGPRYGVSYSALVLVAGGCSTGPPCDSLGLFCKFFRSGVVRGLSDGSAFSCFRWL